jgi:hypothetical protein
VGIFSGFGVVAFRALFGLFHNITFLGSFSFAYDASLVHAAEPVGAVRHPGAGNRRRARYFSHSIKFLITSSRSRDARLASHRLDPAARS